MARTETPGGTEGQGEQREPGAPFIEAPGQAAPDPETTRLDPRRVRSFAGLVVGRLGPRADSAVTHTFLTLVVAQRTASLFMVTFALTAHRLLTWIAYPVIGRMSDRTDTMAGRRTPYMAGGLLIMAVCTALYPSVGSYWLLVGIIVLAKQARVAYSLPEFTSIPEIFGRSRWVKALISVGLGGLVVGTLIRLTVIATWKEDDPTTWRPAFYLAAAILGAAGLAVLFLVREAPAARKLAHGLDAPWRERIDDLLAVPNARILLGALLLASAASGATTRAFPLYAEHVLGATGSSLAGAGLVTGALGVVVSVPIGYVMAVRLRRRQIIVLMPLIAAVEAAAHIFLNALWQSVALGLVIGAVGVAFAMAIAPFALQMLPRSGSMGERFGLFVGPTAFVGVLASYASSLTYDHVVHDYRVIWVFPAVLLLIGVPLLARIHVPPGREKVDPPALFEQLTRIFSAPEEKRRALFGGEVTSEDVDPMAFFDKARQAGASLLEDVDATRRAAMAKLLSELPSVVDGAVIEAVLEWLHEDAVLEADDRTYVGQQAVVERLLSSSVSVPDDGLEWDENGYVVRITTG